MAGNEKAPVTAAADDDAKKVAKPPEKDRDVLEGAGAQGAALVNARLDQVATHSGVVPDAFPTPTMTMPRADLEKNPQTAIDQAKTSKDGQLTFKVDDVLMTVTANMKPEEVRDQLKAKTAAIETLKRVTSEYTDGTHGPGDSYFRFRSDFKLPEDEQGRIAAAAANAMGRPITVVVPNEPTWQGGNFKFTVNPTKPGSDGVEDFRSQMEHAREASSAFLAATDRSSLRADEFSFKDGVGVADAAKLASAFAANADSPPNVHINGQEIRVIPGMTATEVQAAVAMSEAYKRATTEYFPKDAQHPENEKLSGLYLRSQLETIGKQYNVDPDKLVGSMSGDMAHRIETMQAASAPKDAAEAAANRQMLDRGLQERFERNAVRPGQTVEGSTNALPVVAREDVDKDPQALIAKAKDSPTGHYIFQVGDARMDVSANDSQQLVRQQMEDKLNAIDSLNSLGRKQPDGHYEFGEHISDSLRTEITRNASAAMGQPVRYTDQEGAPQTAEAVAKTDRSAAPPQTIAENDLRRNPQSVIDQSAANPDHQYTFNVGEVQMVVKPDMKPEDVMKQLDAKEKAIKLLHDSTTPRLVGSDLAFEPKRQTPPMSDEARAKLFRDAANATGEPVNGIITPHESFGPPIKFTVNPGDNAKDQIQSAVNARARFMQSTDWYRDGDTYGRRFKDNVPAAAAAEMTAAIAPTMEQPLKVKIGTQEISLAPGMTASDVQTALKAGQPTEQPRRVADYGSGPYDEKAIRDFALKTAQAGEDFRINGVLIRPGSVATPEDAQRTQDAAWREYSEKLPSVRALWSQTNHEPDGTYRFFDHISDKDRDNIAARAAQVMGEPVKYYDKKGVPHTASADRPETKIGTANGAPKKFTDSEIRTALNNAAANGSDLRVNGVLLHTGYPNSPIDSAAMQERLLKQYKDKASDLEALNGNAQRGGDGVYRFNDANLHDISRDDYARNAAAAMGQPVEYLDSQGVKQTVQPDKKVSDFGSGPYDDKAVRDFIKSAAERGADMRVNGVLIHTGDPRSPKEMDAMLNAAVADYNKKLPAVKEFWNKLESSTPNGVKREYSFFDGVGDAERRTLATNAAASMGEPLSYHDTRGNLVTVSNSPDVQAKAEIGPNGLPVRDEGVGHFEDADIRRMAQAALASGSDMRVNGILLHAGDPKSPGDATFMQTKLLSEYKQKLQNLDEFNKAAQRDESGVYRFNEPGTSAARREELARNAAAATGQPVEYFDPKGVKQTAAPERTMYDYPVSGPLSDKTVRDAIERSVQSGEDVRINRVPIHTGDPRSAAEMKKMVDAAMAEYKAKLPDAQALFNLKDRDSIYQEGRPVEFQDWIGDSERRDVATKAAKAMETPVSYYDTSGKVVNVSNTAEAPPAEIGPNGRPLHDEGVGDFGMSHGADVPVKRMIERAMQDHADLRINGVLLSTGDPKLPADAAFMQDKLFQEYKQKTEDINRFNRNATRGQDGVYRFNDKTRGDALRNRDARNAAAALGQAIEYVDSTGANQKVQPERKITGDDSWHGSDIRDAEARAAIKLAAEHGEDIRLNNVLIHTGDPRTPKEMNAMLDAAVAEFKSKFPAVMSLLNMKDREETFQRGANGQMETFHFNDGIGDTERRAVATNAARAMGEPINYLDSRGKPITVSGDSVAPPVEAGPNGVRVRDEGEFRFGADSEGAVKRMVANAMQSGDDVLINGVRLQPGKANEKDAAAVQDVMWKQYEAKIRDLKTLQQNATLGENGIYRFNSDTPSARDRDFVARNAASATGQAIKYLDDRGEVQTVQPAKKIIENPTGGLAASDVRNALARAAQEGADLKIDGVLMHTGDARTPGEIKAMADAQVKEWQAKRFDVQDFWKSTQGVKWVGSQQVYDFKSDVPADQRSAMALKAAKAMGQPVFYNDNGQIKAVSDSGQPVPNLDQVRARAAAEVGTPEKFDVGAFLAKPNGDLLLAEGETTIGNRAIGIRPRDGLTNEAAISAAYDLAKASGRDFYLTIGHANIPVLQQDLSASANKQDFMLRAEASRKREELAYESDGRATEDKGEFFKNRLDSELGRIFGRGIGDVRMSPDAKLEPGQPIRLDNNGGTFEAGFDTAYQVARQTGRPVVYNFDGIPTSIQPKAGIDAPAAEQKAELKELSEAARKDVDAQREARDNAADAAYRDAAVKALNDVTTVEKLGGQDVYKFNTKPTDDAALEVARKAAAATGKPIIIDTGAGLVQVTGGMKLQEFKDSRQRNRTAESEAAEHFGQQLQDARAAFPTDTAAQALDFRDRVQKDMSEFKAPQGIPPEVWQARLMNSITGVPDAVKSNAFRALASDEQARLKTLRDASISGTASDRGQAQSRVVAQIEELLQANGGHDGRYDLTIPAEPSRLGRVLSSAPTIQIPGEASAWTRVSPSDSEWKRLTGPDKPRYVPEIPPGFTAWKIKAQNSHDIDRYFLAKVTPNEDGSLSVQTRRLGDRDPTPVRTVYPDGVVQMQEPNGAKTVQLGSYRMSRADDGTYNVTDGYGRSTVISDAAAIERLDQMLGTRAPLAAKDAAYPPEIRRQLDVVDRLSEVLQDNAGNKGQFDLSVPRADRSVVAGALLPAATMKLPGEQSVWTQVYPSDSEWKRLTGPDKPQYVPEIPPGFTPWKIAAQQRGDIDRYFLAKMTPNEDGSLSVQTRRLGDRDPGPVRRIYADGVVQMEEPNGAKTVQLGSYRISRGDDGAYTVTDGSRRSTVISDAAAIERLDRMLGTRAPLPAKDARAVNPADRLAARAAQQDIGAPTTALLDSMAAGALNANMKNESAYLAQISADLKNPTTHDAAVKRFQEYHNTDGNPKPLSMTSLDAQQLLTQRSQLADNRQNEAGRAELLEAAYKAETHTIQSANEMLAYLKETDPQKRGRWLDGKGNTPEEFARALQSDVASLRANPVVGVSTNVTRNNEAEFKEQIANDLLSSDPAVRSRALARYRDLGRGELGDPVASDMFHRARVDITSSEAIRAISEESAFARANAKVAVDTAIAGLMADGDTAHRKELGYLRSLQTDLAASDGDVAGQAQRRLQNYLTGELDSPEGREYLAIAKDQPAVQAVRTREIAFMAETQMMQAAQNLQDNLKQRHKSVPDFINELNLRATTAGPNEAAWLKQIAADLDSRDATTQSRAMARYNNVFLKEPAEFRNDVAGQAWRKALGTGNSPLSAATFRDQAFAAENAYLKSEQQSEQVLSMLSKLSPGSAEEKAYLTKIMNDLTLPGEADRVAAAERLSSYLTRNVNPAQSAADREAEFKKLNGGVVPPVVADTADDLIARPDRDSRDAIGREQVARDIQNAEAARAYLDSVRPAIAEALRLGLVDLNPDALARLNQQLDEDTIRKMKPEQQVALANLIQARIQQESEEARRVAAGRPGPITDQPGEGKVVKGFRATGIVNAIGAILSAAL